MSTTVLLYFSEPACQLQTSSGRVNNREACLVMNDSPLLAHARQLARLLIVIKRSSFFSPGSSQQRKLIEERLIPRAVDADDSDGEDAKNEEEEDDR